MDHPCSGQQFLLLVDSDPCKSGHLMAHGLDLVVLDLLKSSWSALVAGDQDIVNLVVLVVAHKE